MTARVGVTTAADAATRQLGALREAGLEGISLPCIEIAVVGDPEAIDQVVRSAELAIVTSARTVRLVWPAGGMPPVPVAAVGPVTAEAVRAAGGRVAVVGDGGVRELVSALGARVSGLRVAFPQARAADPEGIDRLVAAGAEVEAPVVYETTPVAPPLDPVNIAVFGSPSAVTGWMLSRSFEEVTPVAVGVATAAALRTQGVGSLVVAERPELGALVAAAKTLSERRSA